MATDLSQIPLPASDRAFMTERAHKAVGALADYAAAIARHRDDRVMRDEARVALSRYVEELRTERVAPERALITVKVVARSLAADMGIRAREALVDETVRWCVDAYYGAQSAGGDSQRSASQ